MIVLQYWHLNKALKITTRAKINIKHDRLATEKKVSFSRVIWQRLRV